MRNFPLCLALLCSLTGLTQCSPTGVTQEAGTEALFLKINNQYSRIDASLNLPQQPTKQIVLVQAHPWGSSAGSSFPARPLADEGYAVLSLNTRAVNKSGGQPDEMLEPLLLDVAAGVQEMKDRGYQTIILTGGSAGGPLMSLYQNVAENGNAVFKGQQKLYRFAGFFDQSGKPLSLPKGDGLIFRNPISGTGTTFLNRLDPSVLDEETGRRDPSLDMYDSVNNFNPKTGLASYYEEFIKKYGRAQAARMNRLIDLAQRRFATVQEGKGPYTDDDLIIISRVNARLYFTDMGLGHGKSPHLVLPDDTVSIPGHDRAPGHYSLFGQVSDRNSSVQSAVVFTTRSFLSMRAVRAGFINPMATTLKEWGVDVTSTNNTTVGNMMQVQAPWVLFAGTADDKINTAELIYNEAKSKDKQIIVLRGATHGITSVDSERFSDTKTLRRIMVEQMVQWINKRFR